MKRTLARLVAGAIVPAASLVVLAAPSDGADPTEHQVRLDPTFSSGTGNRAGVVTTDFAAGEARGRAVTVQPDGRIVAAGSATMDVGCSAHNTGFAVVRYLPGGSLDPSFGEDGKAVRTVAGSEGWCPGGTEKGYSYTGIPSSVELDEDGRVLVGGTAMTPYHMVGAVARFTSAGAPDNTFGGDGAVVLPVLDAGLNSESASVQATHVLPDGSMVVAVLQAALQDETSEQRNHLILHKLTTEGRHDTSFGEDGMAVVELDPRVYITNGGFQWNEFPVGLASTPGGRLLVTAPFMDRLGVYGFTANGALDAGFGENGLAQVPAPGDVGLAVHPTDLVLQGDGKVVIGGGSPYIENGQHPRQEFLLARFDGNGDLDPGFGDAGVAMTDLGARLADISSMVIDGGGGIVASGRVFPGDGTGWGWGLTRFHSDGSVDLAFADGGRWEPSLWDNQYSGQTVREVALAPDGKLVVVGMRNRVGDGTRGFAVARLHRAPEAARNGMIAFQRSMPDSAFSVDVFVIHQDWAEAQNLTSTPTSDDDKDWNAEFYPAWSPDNTRVAYFFAGKADGSDGGIVTQSVWGQDRQIAVPFEDSGWVEGIAWSPEGRRLAFSGTPSGLHVARTDGSGIRTLSDLPALAGLEDFGYPAWSPDGQRIAFSAYDGDTTQVFTVGADGTGLVQVTSHAQDSYDPSYSPDGKQLVFASNRGPDADLPGRRDLYIVDVDGSGERFVLDTGHNDISPSFAPDGSGLLFVLHVGGGAHTIHTVDLDGTELTPIVEGQYPSWGPAVPASDTDGIPDAYDNCAYDDNVDQTDGDGDGTGDVCDWDEEPPPPTDTEAPTVTGRDPAVDATGVPVDNPVTVTFSEPVDPATVHSGSVELMKGDTSVPATVQVDGSTVTLDPTKPLKGFKDYSVMVRGGSGGVADLAGNPLAADDGWWFTTNAAPTVAAISPKDGSTTKDRTPKIKFEVSDVEGAVKKKQVEVLVDGDALSFDYAKGIGVLSPKLKVGKHTVTVTATDSAGAATTTKWGFTVKKRR